MKDTINALFQKSKASVYITYNSHKNNYQSVKEYFEERKLFDPDIMEEIPNEVLLKMIELDTIIEIQAYIDTPIGFILSYHYDIDEAINKILKD